MKKNNRQKKMFFSSSQSMIKIQQVQDCIIIEQNKNSLTHFSICQTIKNPHFDRDNTAYLINLVNSQIDGCAFQYITTQNLKKYDELYYESETRQQITLRKILNAEPNDILAKFEFYSFQKLDYFSISSKFDKFQELFNNYYQQITNINQYDQQEDSQIAISNLVAHLQQLF